MLYTNQRHTLEELKTLTGDAPPPEAGSSYAHIPHWDFVNEFLDEARRRGWSFDTPIVHLAREGSQVAVSFPHLGPIQADGSLLRKDIALGFINSTDQRFKARAFLAVDGIVIKSFAFQKHVRKQADMLSDRIKEIFATYARTAAHTTATKNKLERLPVRNRDRLMMQAGREGVMKWSRLGAVDKLFSQYGESQWDLLAAFAEVNSLSPPLRQMPWAARFFELVTAYNNTGGKHKQRKLAAAARRQAREQGQGPDNAAQAS